MRSCEHEITKQLERSIEDRLAISIRTREWNRVWGVIWGPLWLQIDQRLRNQHIGSTLRLQLQLQEEREIS